MGLRYSPDTVDARERAFLNDNQPKLADCRLWVAIFGSGSVRNRALSVRQPLAKLRTARTIIHSTTNHATKAATTTGHTQGFLASQSEDGSVMVCYANYYLADTGVSRCTIFILYPAFFSRLATSSAIITERCCPPVQPNAIVRYDLPSRM